MKHYCSTCGRPRPKDENREASTCCSSPTVKLWEPVKFDKSTKYRVPGGWFIKTVEIFSDVSVHTIFIPITYLPF